MPQRIYLYYFSFILPSCKCLFKCCEFTFPYPKKPFQVIDEGLDFFLTLGLCQPCLLYTSDAADEL